MANRNICILNGDMSRNGGTERCTAILANELSKRTSDKIIVVDISNKYKSCYFEMLPAVKIVHLNIKNVPNGIIKFRQIIKQYNIDVVINVEAMLGIYSVPATIFTKIKNIVWEHGNFFQKQCNSIDIVRALEIKLCDRYVTLTEKDKQNFEKNFQGKCKIDYIYNPIEIPSKVTKYNAKSKILLSVGLVRHIKGFDMLVEVAKNVLDKHGDWIWEIYGSYDTEDEYYKSIVSKIKKYGLEKRLFLKGSTKDIKECYKKAAIMVMTSRTEGLPMTLLEAKSYRLPIVSFDMETGPSEIINDSINGYLIKPYDTKEMSDKICRLIENDELRQSFSDNAYIGIEKFDIDKIMKKWIEVVGE
ncbi:MAG: glycosyltransferase family 4 protein [Clostridia bacterium]|nr:glycosyltransferase family 4 protein [Clostridia bacterium]